jgi:predicted transcriptional regulator
MRSHGRLQYGGFLVSKKMVSLRLDDGLVDWLDAYAAERDTTRTVLLESAIAAFQEDAKAGVPELRERVRAANTPRPGVCTCPELPPDGQRGFSQKCMVHGGRSREDFAEFSGERSALFQRLETPLSAKGLQKPGTPPSGGAA